MPFSMSEAFPAPDARGSREKEKASGRNFFSMGKSLGGNTKGREMKKFELSLPKTNASALLFRGIDALVCKNGRYR